MAHRRQAGHYGAAVAAAVLTVFVAARSAPDAWQGRGGGGGGGIVLLPVAASSLARDAAPYVGKNVTLTATVDAQLTPTAFTVDQDKTKSTGQDVLILVPTLRATPSLNGYVTVIGEVVRFDPDDAAKRLQAKGASLDLSPAIIAKYRGRPAVIATSVIDATLDDLAKVPPPPLTPEEAAFSAVMQRVNPASAALRAAVAESNVEATRAQAEILKAGFTEVETFFKGRGVEDATGWAQEARRIVETVVGAAAVARWDEAATSAGSLTQMCQQCHAAHRVRLEDGSFRIKPGR